VPLVTDSNESFKIMAEGAFPQCQAVIRAPVHQVLGELGIGWGGILSMVRAGIGTQKRCCDMEAAG
jgi:hypothetical protein